MSHINIDPDCIEDIKAAALEVGIAAPMMTGGLVYLWLDCGMWTPAMSSAQVRSYFGGFDVCAALAKRDFIRPGVEADHWVANPVKGHFVREGGEA